MYPWHSIFKSELMPESIYLHLSECFYTWALLKCDFLVTLIFEILCHQLLHCLSTQVPSCWVSTKTLIATQLPPFLITQSTTSPLSHSTALPPLQHLSSPTAHSISAHSTSLSKTSLHLHPWLVLPLRQTHG